MEHQTIDEAAEWKALGTGDRNAYRVSDRVVDMRRSIRPIRSVQVPALPQGVVFDLEKTALIVIDMQNDFCAHDGAGASPRPADQSDECRLARQGRAGNLGQLGCAA